MKKLFPLAFIATIVFSLPGESFAQRGERGGGDRGGRGGGERGGDRGGERGGPGGSTRGGFGGPPGGSTRGGFGGPPGGSTRGGFGGPPSGRPTMDANGDGRLDAGEIQRMPEQLRTMMESRGISIRPGLSMDDFRSKIREGFERARAAGESPFQRPGSSADDGRGNRSRYAPPSSFRPRDREPLTKTLPDKYTEMDVDFDGQIALYEWMKTRRTDLEAFDLQDANKDGYLTPVELHAYEEVSDQDEPQVVSYVRERVTIVGGGQTVNGSGKSVTSTSSKKAKKALSNEEKAKHEGRANFFAKYIDKNGDGKIEMAEWESNAKASGFMKENGQKLKSMSVDEFVKRYVKIQADKSSR